MRRRATSAKVKAEARRPRAPKAPKKQAAGTRELEKRLAEALEQQTATAEILRVISSSPTDIQPVLDAVAERAARLCEATDVVIRRVGGDRLHIVAHFGVVPVTVDKHRITRGSVGGRAVLERRTVHVHDVLSGVSRKEYPDAPALQSKGGHHTILAVPLVREGAATGIILIRRLEVRPFTDKQIELLETFAAQAVIAIENVRLFNETKEALEQQTATAEILKVISSSPTDTQPVFDAILENACRLCDAHMASLQLHDGVAFRRTANRGFPPAYAKWVAEEGYKLTPQGAILQMAETRRPVHILDRRESPGYLRRQPSIVALVELAGVRTFLAVPMMKDGRVVGAISVNRPEVRAFTQKQIDLLTTFADQAVIAIENVRLFKELQARNAEVTEALEQQTATAEILSVISSSPTDLQPVFGAILEKAIRLCDAHMGHLGLYDGEKYLYVAQRGASAEYARFLNERGPFQPPAGGALGRMIAEQQPIHVADRTDSPDYRDGLPGVVAMVELGGARTFIDMPMLKEGRVVGGIHIYRPVVQPFTQKQIDLVSTFANQAVIAIENVRLFNETKDALERQTSIAEILRVISSTPTDVMPVLEAVTHRAAQLCGAQDARLFLLEGNILRSVAGFGEFGGTMPTRPLTRGYPMGRAVIDQSVVHVEDIAAELDEFPDSRLSQQQFGNRTTLAVPLVRENKAFGAILMRRKEVLPFNGKQIDLVKTFADQAVIAIENVRLFNETKEALERQTATAEILKVISSSLTDTRPVFEAIVKNGAQLFHSKIVSLRLVAGTVTELAASTVPAPLDPIPLTDDRSLTARAILRREVIQVSDVFAEEWVGEATRRRAEHVGYRSIISAPMLKEGVAIGVINVMREAPRPFTDDEVTLLRTFASQAVIAIENVRLFKELQARNAEVTEALEQQTATADILRVISGSPTDIQPVFDTIAESAARLCGAGDVVIRRVDGDMLRAVAHFGPVSVARPDVPISRASYSGRAVVDRRLIHLPNVLDPSVQVEYPDGGSTLFQNVSFRSWLAAPLLREGTAIGVIVMRRAEQSPFSEKQIKLLQIFADQAVIAIENVRLFKELQARNAEITEALEQQTATADILRVISSSPTDIQPVFDAIAQSAARLCGADDVVIRQVEGNSIRLVAHIGPVTLDRSFDVRPLSVRTISGSAIREGRTLHVHDISEPRAREQYPESAVVSREGGWYRTVLVAPLLREGTAIGTILIRRKEVGPFSDKQIKLLETFANQAVIAIENVRLFNEIQDKSRQLEVASRHKSQFLANMSHELRTPLNAILGYTELILDGIYGDVSGKVRDVMGRVDKSGRHLLGLINDVLDLSKIEAGQLTLALADYSLADVVQTVITSVESLAAEKTLALEVTLAPDLPRGRGDDRRLAQVLLNLVGNAIKFTEAGEVRLEARCSNGAFVVAVADTGPGISEADQQRIFEEFQQVDDSATRKKGGTGLGLSIARRIVELHGGRIGVESAPGRGATFTVTLPVRVERQAVPA